MSNNSDLTAECTTQLHRVYLAASLSDYTSFPSGPRFHSSGNSFGGVKLAQTHFRPPFRIDNIEETVTDIDLPLGKPKIHLDVVDADLFSVTL